MAASWYVLTSSASSSSYYPSPHPYSTPCYHPILYSAFCSSCPRQSSPASSAFPSSLAIFHLRSLILSKPICISHWSLEIHFSHFLPWMENSPYKASHSFTLFLALTLVWAPAPTCTTSFMLGILGILCLLGLLFDTKDGARCYSKIIVNLWQTM